MLIFTDPGCRPCNALLPQVADWQQRHRQRLTIALVSRGSLEDNRADVQSRGLGSVLLQEDREISTVYHAHGTPSGVLVSTDGRIASSVAAGAVAIEALVEDSVATGLSVIRPGVSGAANGHPAAPVIAAGLAVGSEAPRVTWEDLQGSSISLGEFSGEPLVLLFWNPGCGFCQRMLPGLRVWEDEPPPGAPALLIVSSGEAERNRAMGLRSRVVLDQTFHTARSFGASGTPSAIKLDEAGRVATPLAVGAPDAFALLHATQHAQPAQSLAAEVR